MNRNLTRLVLTAILATLLITTYTHVAFAALTIPEPTGYVSDFAGILSQQSIDSLNNRLGSYEKKSGNEIAVVTVRNLQGTTIEDFAVRLFEKWKIGKSERDNGVLFLIAQQEREVRIEVGYGLEPDLTDAESYGIINNVVTPAFKAGDYDRGITAGTEAMIKAISGEGMPELDPAYPGGTPKRVGGGSLAWLFYLGTFMVFGIFQWFVSILGRTKSWWLGGAIGALVGLAITIFSVVLGIIAIALLTPLGLLFDYIVSRAYEENKKRPHSGDRGMGAIPWWAGGHWGPGSSGGGRGFGGFGGGRSGGGGASGGW